MQKRVHIKFGNFFFDRATTALNVNRVANENDREVRHAIKGCAKNREVPNFEHNSHFYFRDVGLRKR